MTTPDSNKNIVLDLEGVSAQNWTDLLQISRELEALGIQRVEDNIEELLNRLHAMFHAHRSGIIIAVRTPLSEHDVLLGWRAAWFHSNGGRASNTLINKAVRLSKWIPSDGYFLEYAGTRRAGYQHTDNYPGHRSQVALMKMFGVTSRIGCITPIGENVEVYLILARPRGTVLPDRADASLCLAASHVLEPFFQRWCCHLGVLDGNLLTGRERDALLCLLMGRSEKEGADELGLAQSSFHQLTVSVYRKLSVQSRGELLSKCLLPIHYDTQPWDGRIVKMGALEEEEAPSVM